MDSTERSVQSQQARAEARQWKMDTLVGYILLAGVLLSMALVAAGLVWRWVATGQLGFDYRLAGMNLFELATHDVRLSFQGAVRPRLLVTTGIVVLMLTPFFRVAASVVYFAAVLKNWKYTVFTSIVLVVLTYSLFLR